MNEEKKAKIKEKGKKVNAHKVKRIYLERSLAEMGSLSLKNQGVKYLLCTIDVFPNIFELNLRNIKQLFALHGFIRTLKEFKRKRNKLWIDQGKEF